MKSPSSTQVVSSGAHKDAVRGVRTLHPCEVTLDRGHRSGEPCGKEIGTAFVDGQWRCPSHRPHAPKAPAPKPPVTHLKEPSDALKLSSWAALQASLGRLSPQQANSIANLCREFRRSFEMTQGRAQANRIERLLGLDKASEAAEQAGDHREAQRLAAKSSIMHDQPGLTEAEADDLLKETDD